MSSVSVEDGPFSILLPESFLEALPNPIDKLGINFSSDLKIVITKNNISVESRKQNSSILLSGDLEIKGDFCVFETDSRSQDWEAEVSQWIDREDTILWHLESFFVLVGYFEHEVIEGEGMECENKVFCDRACWLEIVFVLAGVLEDESDGRTALHRGLYSIVRDREGRQQQQCNYYKDHCTRYAIHLILDLIKYPLLKKDKKRH